MTKPSSNPELEAARKTMAELEEAERALQAAFDLHMERVSKYRAAMAVFALSESEDERRASSGAVVRTSDRARASGARLLVALAELQVGFA